MTIFWNPSVSVYIFHCLQLFVKNAFITVPGNIRPRKHGQMKAQGGFRTVKFGRKEKFFMELVSGSMGFFEFDICV